MGLITAIVISLLAAASALAATDIPTTSNFTLTEVGDIPRIGEGTSSLGCADCPPAAQIEGEPVCHEQYVDQYNGGCNSAPPVFTTVTCGTICGETGTWVVGAFTFRDTDWYQITVGPGTFSFSGISNGFTLRLIVLDDICPAMQLSTITSVSCTPSDPLTFNGPGTFYLFASTEFSPPTPCGSSPYVLTITGPGIPPCQAATGACCRSDGTCSVVTADECSASGGTYQGDGTDCDPNPCAAPTGACCLTDGSCSIQTLAECQAAGGTYQGDGTACDPNPCAAPPTGACCLPGGACSITTEAQCTDQGGFYVGDDTDCDPNPCVTPAEPSTWGRIKSVYGK